MSFILDALKKSETDRQRQSSPALFEVKVAAPRRRFPGWAIGIGALLGVNVLVLSWVLLRQPAPPEVAAPVAAANASKAEASAPGDNRHEDQGMVTVKIPVGTASSFTVTPNKPEPGVVAASSTPPLAEEPQLSRQEPSIPPDYDARDYAPAVTPAAARAAASQRAGSVQSRDEVLAAGTQLPDLRLDLHVYDLDPAKRFVFINMHKLREGEMLPDGVRVEHITQTGALLVYKGTRFTLDGG